MFILYILYSIFAYFILTLTVCPMGSSKYLHHHRRTNNFWWQMFKYINRKIGSDGWWPINLKDTQEIISYFDTLQELWVRLLWHWTRYDHDTCLFCLKKDTCHDCSRCSALKALDKSHAQESIAVSRRQKIKNKKSIADPSQQLWHRHTGSQVSEERSPTLSGTGVNWTTQLIFKALLYRNWAEARCKCSRQLKITKVTSSLTNAANKRTLSLS